MGFFDNKADTSIDKMFDFNKDGKLDGFERATQYESFRQFCEDNEKETYYKGAYDNAKFEMSKRYKRSKFLFVVLMVFAAIGFIDLIIELIIDLLP